MLKTLLPILLIAGVSYFGWNHFNTKPPATPEERIEVIRCQGSCTAQELAELSETHPRLVEKALKGRMISVSGTLSKALIKGVASSDLILELDGSGGRKVDFHSDFQQFTRMIEGFQQGEFKFQKFGNEIVVVQVKKSPKKSRNAEDQGMEAETETRFEPVVKLREGDHLNLKGLFQHVGARTVIIQLREMP